MRSRGLTLLEVMIALGLILALMTVALPAVLHRLPGTVWDETLTQLRAGVRHAAVDCRRAGEPLELVAREEATGRWVLEARPLSAPPLEAMDAEDARVLTPGELEEAARLAEAMSVAAGARVYMRMPREYRVTRLNDEARAALSALPTNEELDASMPMEEREQAAEAMHDALAEALSEEDGAAATEVTLAILMPDGTAITGEPVVLLGPGGRRAELSVRAWSSELDAREGVAAPEEETPQEEDVLGEDTPSPEPSEDEDPRGGKAPKAPPSGKKGP